MQTDGKTRSSNQSEPHSRATQAKRKPAKTQCFRRFLAGAEGLGFGCRLGRAWTQPAGLQAPTTRTAGGPAGAPRCQILPHTNEKSQVPQKRYLTFLAGAEGLEPSARGFGVDVGKRTGGTGEGQCCPVSNASPGEDGAGLVLWEIFRAKTGEKEREIPEKT